MKIMFMSLRGLKLAAVYVLALALLIGGAGLFLPRVTTQMAMAEPYRAGEASSNTISLAINVDWGEEYLPDMLAVLEENDITATFFLTGRWCDNNAELSKAIATAGHEIGNHGYSHSSPNKSSLEEVIEEIRRTEEAVQNATGITTNLYAPPSGESEAHVLQAAQQAGYHTILWSVDTIDWQKPDADTVIERVTSKIHGGAIILAHPTECILDALPTLIERLKTEGYAFVSVSQNLGL